MESCRRINCFHLYSEERPASVPFTHQIGKYEHLIVWAVHRGNKSGPWVEVLVEIRL